MQMLRTSVERAMSARLGRAWQAASVRDLGDRACHPCAVLSDGAWAVFAKYSDAPDARPQFEAELVGLRLLAGRAGVRTPTPLGIEPAGEGYILVLQAVQEIARGPQQWREIGRALACIHQVHGERFGLETAGYFGPLPQDNTPMDDWPSFYAERRLWPGLRLAIEAGHLPREVARAVERLIERLPGLCGPRVMPTLLHGDAQQNNWISTESGAVAIDPAVYYGHPEMDLAYVDYFEPVPDEVLDGYREVLAVDPGFAERRDLWRIWGYLAAVTVEGAAWLDRLAQAVRRYL